ncbi:hypothetical protein HM1_1459 [Heliomicrobium modesticaldum Ice1]|uniref:Uncharacterized protein n=1 Tax=Heliobacterium modesticaldum (strain ATCC 51547 / Ice1) TaxID=498761 RepID=B0TCK6_HELMI|nr:hypothetical protein HM1_1459 [Heliomicrobium modesticaldum Ice1]
MRCLLVNCQPEEVLRQNARKICGKWALQRFCNGTFLPTSLSNKYTSETKRGEADEILYE